MVLERREVASSWRHERWDSLRLLTPTWQVRLPGYEYEGDDPDGFLTMPEVVELLTHYAEAIDAPVQGRTTVTAVRPDGDDYVVETDQGPWRCRTVVLASGAFSTPRVPELAEGVPDSVATITPDRYRNPDQLADGGVLVVGASATGVQIADELARSGREVTMAIGEHVRGPRTYRGRDIQWWMESCGVLDERYDEVDDIVRARHVPSMQLVGTPEHVSIDLNSLQASGVRPVGRLAMMRDGKALLSGSLRNKCELADLKLDRLLDTIDEWAATTGVETAEGSYRLPRTVVPDPPVLEIDLRSGEIETIVWASGFRPDTSWLDPALLDAKGMVRHDGGIVTDAPGMYVLGAPFLRRRKSSFIDGGRADAEDLVAALAAHLDGQRVPVS